MCLFPAMEVVALSMNVAETPHAVGVLLLDPSRPMHIRFHIPLMTNVVHSLVQMNLLWLGPFISPSQMTVLSCHNMS